MVYYPEGNTLDIWGRLACRVRDFALAVRALGLRFRILRCVSLRVQVLNIWILGFGVEETLVEVLGKCMIIGYLDP